MAKRKRLTPANPAFLDTAPDPVPGLSAAAMRSAPIADVAREASATAAAQELAQTLTQARETGRMVISVPLRDIQTDYLVRDRVVVQDDEMQALKDSLRARGQQTPVELVALDGGGYGLISGWRRCAALAALHAETGEDHFSEVQGLLRRPTEAAEAYLAMVEENEIRVGLSYFERARIVAKSVERGVFDHDRAALQDLFQSASRAKRSKIGSFLPVVRALDGALRFPEALTERLGLALSKAMHIDTDLATRLRRRLETSPAEAADQEVAQIEAEIAAPVARASVAPNETSSPLPAAKPSHATEAGQTPDGAPNTVPNRRNSASPAPDREFVVGGIHLSQVDGQIILDGSKVDEVLKRRLITWLRRTY